MKLMDPDTCWNAWTGLFWITMACVVIAGVVYVQTGRELTWNELSKLLTDGAQHGEAPAGGHGPVAQAGHGATDVMTPVAFGRFGNSQQQSQNDMLVF